MIKCRFFLFQVVVQINPNNEADVIAPDIDDVNNNVETDPGLIFRTSVMTPRTPPPKAR